MKKTILKVTSRW